MKHTLLLALALLSGCSTVGHLENRVSCTVAKDQAHFLSMYGPVGVASVIDPKDAAVLCK